MRSAFALRRALLSSARTTRIAATPCRAARFYSAQAQATKLKELDASKLCITKATQPKPLSKPEDLVFGKMFTGMPYYPMLAHFALLTEFL